ncbi:MAG: hypothetical protein LAT76_08580, partial [Schleiferiaceae bacterium]|nr:hypothetical protein [Schleiferiaceae bacterium]
MTIGKRRFPEGFMPSAWVYRCAGFALARSLLRSPSGSQFMECVWGVGVRLCFVAVFRFPEWFRGAYALWFRVCVGKRRFPEGFMPSAWV